MGCGKTVYRSHEGHYCSSTRDDDPFFECSPSYDYVCINTYAEQVQTSGGQEPRFQEIYLCRMACDPTIRNPCLDLRDVCCKGPIFGRDYGKQHACVPAGQCQTQQDEPDGGARQDRPSDTRPDTTVTVDAPADVPADGPADAPQTIDSDSVDGGPDADSVDAPPG